MEFGLAFNHLLGSKLDLASKARANPGSSFEQTLWPSFDLNWTFMFVLVIWTFHEDLTEIECTMLSTNSIRGFSLLKARNSLGWKSTLTKFETYPWFYAYPSYLQVSKWSDNKKEHFAKNKDKALKVK